MPSMHIEWTRSKGGADTRWGGARLLLPFEFWDRAREGSFLRAAPGAKRATVTMSLCAWKHS